MSEPRKAEELARVLKGIVRNAAYNVIRTKAQVGTGECYSRARGLYDAACYALKLVVPLSEADKIIADTYEV